MQPQQVVYTSRTVNPVQRAVSQGANQAISMAARGAVNAVRNDPTRAMRVAQAAVAPRCVFSLVRIHSHSHSDGVL